MKMSGYLYILSNLAFPSLLKIGQTSERPELRIRQLNSTVVPFPFLLEACFRVANPKNVEMTVHEALEQYRAAQNREFFEINMESALNIIFPLIVTRNILNAKSIPEKSLNEAAPEKEIKILQRIVSGGNTHGIDQFRLYEGNTSAQLDVEIILSNLEHKKFVKCNKNISNYGPTWLPTTKGIKFLSDNNLIEEWMRRPGW